MKVTIGVSNRHLHLTDADYQILFGSQPLEKKQDLVQRGQYSTKQLVTIQTEKDKIEKVRLIGPLRTYTQVEISKTDAYKLGIDPPLRESGDLTGASLLEIIGPCGQIKKKNVLS